MMDKDTVPYIVFEGEMARMERIIKRLWLLVVLLVVLLVASNVAWLEYERQFEEEVSTITQEAYSDGEGPVLVNNGGDLNYGK